MSKWNCSHTPKNKAKYLFNKEYTKQISERYEFNFDKEIEEKIKKNWIISKGIMRNKKLI